MRRYQIFKLKSLVAPVPAPKLSVVAFLLFDGDLSVEPFNLSKGPSLEHDELGSPLSAVDGKALD